MNLKKISAKILNLWRNKFEELENEESIEYLEFDICESIMYGVLAEEKVKLNKELKKKIGIYNISLCGTQLREHEIHRFIDKVFDDAVVSGDEQ